MEKHTFNNFENLGIDFSSHSSSSSVPIPSSQISNNNNTLTLNSLITQNEDLSARLRVLVRRLEKYEQDNFYLRNENQTLIQKFKIFEDQFEIFSTKENHWNQTKLKLESELSQFQKRFPQLLDMESQIERYKRYHEKVKSQIKPYVKQLKDYSDELAKQISNLKNKCSDLEQNNSSLLNTIDENNTNFALTIQQLKNDQNLISDGYEDKINQLKNEISNTLAENFELREKCNYLESLAHDNDNLLNKIIVLERHSKDQESLYRTEVQSHELSIQTIKNELTEVTLKNQDLQNNCQFLREENHKFQHQIHALNEQLTTLRHLWNNKSQENEKLKASIEALENLNNELSQTLNSSRKGMFS